MNFGWHFTPGFEEKYLPSPLEKYETVDLPHAAVEVPYHYFSEEDYQGIFTYEKTFDAEDWEGKLVYVRFEGVMLTLQVYLNGVDLGKRVSGWIPVTYLLPSDILKPKDNRLTVVVDSHEDPSIPPFGKAVDYLTFAGIYRPVSLEAVPKEHIETLFVNGTQEGKLSVKANVTGKSQPIFRLYDGEKLVKEFTEAETEIRNVHLWSLEDPHLYTLKATLENGDERTVRFGFRTVSFREKGFFLNRKKIKLIGLNRHQNYPYVGPAMPKSAQRDDAYLIRHFGANIVRTSHYPQSEDFLSACDELGLLVIDEIPGWQYIGKDAAWREQFQRFLEGMIEKERNHPSLIAYGTRIDESPDDDELYGKAVKTVHEQDPYRPCLGVRNFKNSHCLEDIYCYNDFSCADTQHGLDHPDTVRGAKGKPLLISEHNGHMFPTKSTDTPSRRCEQGLRHLRVINDAFRYDRIAGAIGWCAFDYNTHKDFGSGDHICYHGVFDLFRNAKPAAFAYRSQKDDEVVLELANVPTPGDNDEALLRPLWLFTNCDSVSFYKNNRHIKDFYPDKKDYPYLPHPPIRIDDFIGDLFKEEGFRPHDAKILTEAFNYVGQTGIAHVNKAKLLRYVPASIRNSLSMDRLLALYYKYMSGWGEKMVSYQILGFKDGKKVAEREYGPVTSYRLEVTANQDHLHNGETYDVARVKILALGPYFNLCPYADEALRLETEGPLQVIGPKDIALVGGGTAVYVRTLRTDKPAVGKLIITSGLGRQEVVFSID